nr:reverse transcriptase domain-containing protein [Tanacetum cinerariifolium]
METLVISISSDVSVESVGSSFPRVILIGSNYVEVPVAPEVRATAVASPAGVLELDTHSSSEADPSENSPPPVSVAPMVLPFHTQTIQSQILRYRRGMYHLLHLLQRSLLLLFYPHHLLLLHHHLSFHLHLLLPHPRFVDDDLFLSDPKRTFPLVDFIVLILVGHQGLSSLEVCPVITMYPPTTSKSSARDSSFESSAGPSHKRCKSPAAIVTSSIYSTRALVPSCADLLPPRKRFRDSISPEDSVEEDIDTDVLEDIEANGTAIKFTVDMDVEANINVCIGMEVDVGIDVEDEVEDEVESSDRGTIEVVVDMDAGIDITDGMLMLDVVEHLEQRQLEAGQLIASGKRAGLSDRTRSLERENLKNMNITRSGMTPEVIEELVNHRVEETLAAYKEAHAANAREAKNQSQNGSDGVNRNGGNGNGGNGNGRNENPNENGREGVVGLTRWFEKMETVFHISNRLQKYQVKMVLEEEDRIERYVGGLPDNIQGNVMYFEPTRLQDAIRLANSLMDQKLKGYAVKNAENKRRMKVNKRDKCGQKGPFKRLNVGGQSMARAYTARNNERRQYNGPLPICNKCKLHSEGPCTVRCGKCNKVGHFTRDCKVTNSTTSTQKGQVVNQRVVTCFECGRQGHYRSDCPKPIEKNHRNKAGSKNEVGKARGKAYVLGGGDANPDLNIVKGTFLLSNYYAFVLFDSGADRNFMSSTFSTLLDIIPDTLDVSYAAELADGRISKTNTVLRGCTLGLLGHPFNVDLMPLELGSFDVIIDMDWLANHHAVIVCDEKIVRIPYGDEVLIVQGDRGGKGEKSKLSIISCSNTQKAGLYSMRNVDNVNGRKNELHYRKKVDFELRAFKDITLIYLGTESFSIIDYSLAIVNVKLVRAENYKMWDTTMKITMKIALKEKNKMGFIDGTYVKQETSVVLSQQWERCNAIILGWILGSLSQELYVGQVYSKIASKVWTKLKETYDKIDGSNIFNLMHKINNLKQGDLFVPNYYHKLNSLWREFDILTILPACVCKGRIAGTCDGKSESVKHTQLIKLMQFLIEKNPIGDFSWWFWRASTNNNNNSNRGPNPNLLCKNCGLTGHTMDRCYVLIGCFVGFKRNPNMSKQSRNDNNKRLTRNSEVNHSFPSTSGSLSSSFTNEQMMKLFDLINKKPSPDANMSGIKPNFLSNNVSFKLPNFHNNNVFFNLNFKKFFYAKSKYIMYNVTLDWIIDSDPNQHMTDSTKDMFNIVDISSLMLAVGHPNGTLAKITAIGSLRLTSGIVLFDVLVVPKYSVSLLSVNKMIKDSKFFDFQENYDDEAEERTSEEYLRDLDIEFHERALLANSKLAKTFDWDEEEVSDDKEEIRVQVLMAMDDDELFVGRIMHAMVNG